MVTDKQKLGEFGETLVCQHCICPRCKRERTLRRLRANFECADIICKFCTYVAQVKTSREKNLGKIPTNVTGAAWIPQRERLEKGIYIPLFLVLVKSNDWKTNSIYYLVPDVQRLDIFKPRNKPLSEKAKRAGWWGFNYRFSADDRKLFIKLK